MKAQFKRTAIAILLAPALALPAAAAQAQAAPGTEVNQIRDWNVNQLYRNGWSAEQMLGVNVRGTAGEEIGEVKDIIVGRDGTISRVVVEVGGFLEMGDQHIGVPWRHVDIGPDMQYVQVPLREVESGTFSIFGRVPQGENVWGAPGSWRVQELIGDFAGLADVTRYGMVTDVIFSPQGRALGVIVNRSAGPWGGYGWYGYPYTGYDVASPYYNLPYRSAEVGEFGRFDYVQFAEQSPYAGYESSSVQRQQRVQARQARRAQTAGAMGNTTMTR